MYNKLFTKILDSSIWLAPDQHRIVWVTLLAAMDEDGFVQFASVANLAHRARVARDAAETAMAAFEAPDPDSGDPSNEGRRVERVPGGWVVLNAGKYRVLVTREIAKEKTRERVARFRAKKGNGAVTPGNASVTPSESTSETPKSGSSGRRKGTGETLPDEFVISASLRSYALAKLPGCDVESLFGQFCNNARAKGLRYVSWNGAWRTWVDHAAPNSGHFFAGQYPKAAGGEKGLFE